MQYTKAQEIQHNAPTYYEVILKTAAGERVRLGFTNRKSLSGIEKFVNTNAKATEALLKHCPENVQIKTKGKGVINLSNGATLSFGDPMLQAAHRDTFET